MRTKLMYILIFLFLFYNSYSNAQVENCNITILDSNNIRQDFYDVSLLSFKMDILTFTQGNSIQKINITDLKKLEYFGNTEAPSGLITGAAIGFAIGAAAVIGLTGLSFHGSTEAKVNPLGVIAGGIAVGFVGGLIGGSIQGIHREKVRVYFTEMSLSASRKKLNDIFKFYAN
ncbi:MAG: hypothetical protein ABIY50_05150 [Ignavibacteria bacterium]